ncbi:MAG: hypothetical protein JSS31_16190 [Proteobacteria bacterium]|nr:hypothetical protein [Pseudomonadota bacterium]MBS0495447.1 hypothetical protein [Pseudomonadota bacterium]
MALMPLPLVKRLRVAGTCPSLRRKPQSKGRALATVLDSGFRRNDAVVSAKGALRDVANQGKA